MRLLLYLTAVLLPFSTAKESGAVLSPGLLTLLALVVCLMLRAASLGRRAMLAGIFAMLWAASCLAFCLPSTQLLASSSRGLVFVIAALLFILVTAMRPAPFKSSELMTAVMLFGITLSLYYIGNFIWAAFLYGLSTVMLERYVGGVASLPWGASNVVAATIMLSMVVACLASINRVCRGLPIITLLVGLVAILTTFSRTATLILITLMVLFVLVGQRGFAVFGLLGVIAGVAGAYFYAISSGDLAIQILLSDRLNTEGLSTLNDRRNIWADATQYLSNNPTNPMGYFDSVTHWGVTGHSIVMTTMAEQGYLGLLTLGLFWGFVFWALLVHAIFRPSKSNLFSLLGCLLLFFNLCIEDPYFTHQYAVMLWLTLAILIRPSVMGHDSAQLDTPALPTTPSISSRHR